MINLTRVLLATTSALVLATTIAKADGGAGGINGAASTAGGAGGVTSANLAGGTGGAGGGTNIGGGGGGGAGTTGGNGGGTNGGAGGATAGANGSDATAATAGDSGAGGGGGAHGEFLTVGIVNSAALAGGAGGAGASGDGGGGGGAGGYGLVVNAGMPVTILNTSTITGGAGGAGGANTGTGHGGNGGDGGVGLFFIQGNATINNEGTIAGGTGGAGGAAGGGTAGAAGLQGVGVVGGNLTVINSGAINGAGVANAIDFTSGSNTLTLQNGFSFTGAISVTGSLDLNQSTAQTLNTTIIGTGSITDSGSGTLTLTAANGYTGSTTIGAATLALSGPTGAIASSSGVNLSTATSVFDVTGSTALFGPTVNNLSGVSGSQVKLGTKGLTVNETSATTFAGDISGLGEFEKEGTGTLTLTGVNDLVGTLFIQSGTLALSGSGSVATAASVNVNTGATFDISATTNGASIITLTGAGDVTLGAQDLTLSAAAGSFGGDISGTGGVTIAAGTISFTGVNDFTGDTVIDGALDISGAGSIASSASVRDNGTFDINAASAGVSIVSLEGTGFVNLGNNSLTLTDAAGTFSGAIHGNGGLNIASGTETLSGVSNYSGGTTVNGAALVITSNDAVGTGDVAIDSGALSFADTMTFDHATRISGPAGFFVASGQTATVTSVIADDASAGELISQGPGTLVLAGANTYTGGTSLMGGTLRAANNTAFGTGGVTINDGVLGYAAAVDLSNAITLATDAQLQVLAGTATQTGAISETGGSHSLEKIGAGTLALGGTETYTGDTIITAGTLAITGAGSIAASSSVRDSGTFDISAASAGVSIVSLTGSGAVALGNNILTLTDASGAFSGGINGNGGLNIASGIETLSGVSSYSGGTTVSGGAVLFITSDAAIGTGAIAIDTGALTFADTMTFDHATRISGDSFLSVADGKTATVTSVIADDASAGALISDGPGTLVLAGADTYTGGTTLEGGTLRAANNAAFGTGEVTIVGGVLGYSSAVNLPNAIVLDTDAQLQVLTGTATQSGAISQTGGTHSLEKIGAGTLVIASPESYTGDTIITAGTLRAGANNVFADTGTFKVATGATLDLGGFDETLGELSGSGDVDIGTGTLTVGGNNTSTTFSGILSGDGDLVKTGSGTLTLTGDSTFTGGTTIAGGTLSVQNDGALGTGAVTLSDPVLDYGNGVTLSNKLILAANDAQLQVTTGSATQAGVISQTGGARPLEKIGTGELVLSANNTYTGATTVSAGTLVVDGSIASSSFTTVANDATLSGHGTVGDTKIASGGTFAPGDGTAGSLTKVNGDLTFASGGFYKVMLEPSASTGTSVSGTATLGNATVDANYGPGAYVAKKYTILTATGSIGGKFGSEVDTDLPSNFTSTLSYDAHHVFLNLQLAFVAPMGISQNQKAVGDAIVAYFNAHNGIPIAFGGLTPAGLSQASGEIATATATAAKDAQDQFVNVAMAPRAGNAGHAWSLWGSIYGGGRSTDGNDTVGSHDLSSHDWSGAVGVDYRVTDSVLVGAAYSGGHDSFHLSDALGSGSGDVNQGIVYLRANLWDAAYLAGAYAFGSQDTTTHRATDLNGPAVYRANISGDVDTWRAEGGWRFDADAFGLTPYGAIQSSTYSSPTYGEKTASGTNTFALNYVSRDLTTSRTELGLRTDDVFGLDSGSFILRGRAAWVDNYKLDHALTAGFQTLPGTAFTVDGAVEGRNGALLGLSGEWQVGNGLSLAAGIDGGFADHSSTYTGQGTVRYTW